MATVYVAHEFTDKGGTHAVGEEMNLPEDTDAQASELERMINYGLVTRSRPANPTTSSPSTTGTAHASSSSSSDDDGEGGNNTRSKAKRTSSS